MYPPNFLNLAYLGGQPGQMQGWGGQPPQAPVQYPIGFVPHPTSGMQMQPGAGFHPVQFPGMMGGMQPGFPPSVGPAPASFHPWNQMPSRYPLMQSQINLGALGGNHMMRGTGY